MIQVRPFQPFIQPAGVVSGITLYLYPASTAYDIEIQTAADVNGSPGTWTQLAIIPGYRLIETGTPYSDHLPNDGKRRWYQYRHVADWADPSPFVGPASAVPSQATQPGLLDVTARPRPAYGAQTTDYDGTSLTSVVADTRGFQVNGMFSTTYQNLSVIQDGNGYYRANATQLATANFFSTRYNGSGYTGDVDGANATIGGTPAYQIQYGGQRALAALNANNRLNDQRNIPMVTAGNRNSVVITSNYLNASNPGGSGQIQVNPFTVQFGWGQVNYNGGTIYTNLTAGQSASVWAVDPNQTGGSVSYYASANYQDTIGTGNLYVGSVVIPSNGGTAGGGGGGGCVEVDSWVSDHCQARDVEPGHMLDCLAGHELLTREVVQAVKAVEYRHCYQITAACGAQVIISRGTPVTLITGAQVYIQHVQSGEYIPVSDRGQFRWEPVTVTYCGERWVKPLDLGGATFAAGMTPDQRIYTHNIALKAQ